MPCVENTLSPRGKEIVITTAQVPVRVVESGILYSGEEVFSARPTRRENSWGIDDRTAPWNSLLCKIESPFALWVLHEEPMTRTTLAKSEGTTKNGDFVSLLQRTDHKDFDKILWVVKHNRLA